MSEIRFYHLQRTAEDVAIAQIAAKAYQSGKAVLVRAHDAVEAEKINSALWIFRADSFVPHGTSKDGHADKQPVYITTDDNNPNAAKILILTSSAAHTPMDGFDLRCEMLDGANDDIVTAARVRWKQYKEQGFEISYWQETDNGWVKKA